MLDNKYLTNDQHYLFIEDRANGKGEITSGFPAECVEQLLKVNKSLTLQLDFAIETYSNRRGVI